MCLKTPLDNGVRFNRMRVIMLYNYRVVCNTWKQEFRNRFGRFPRRLRWVGKKRRSSRIVITLLRVFYNTSKQNVIRTRLYSRYPGMLFLCRKRNKTVVFETVQWTSQRTLISFLFHGKDENCYFRVTIHAIFIETLLHNVTCIQEQKKRSISLLNHTTR